MVHRHRRHERVMQWAEFDETDFLDWNHDMVLKVLYKHIISQGVNIR